MARVLTNLPFEEWVRYIFDHPVTDPAWYWDADADSLELDPLQNILFTTQLFSHSTETLSVFTDAQVNQGLWLLVSETTSDLRILGDAALPLADRIRCIDSILLLFEDCFGRRCTPHLSHIDETGVGPLNSICYMWWDIFPLFGRPEDTARSDIDGACLAVMQKTLEVPSIACQEGGLHGLGHWANYYSDRCGEIITTFLAQHPDVRPEMRDYATRAREANIL